MKLVRYVPGASFLHRLDPRSKFCLCSSLMLTSFAFSDPIYLLFVLVVVVLVGHAAGLADELMSKARPLAPVVIMSFVLWTLFYESSLFGGSELSEVLFSFGPIAIVKKGLLYGLAMPIRVLILILVPMMYFMMTKVHDIVLFITKVGMDYRWAFTFGLSMKLVSVLGEAFTTIRQAQAARGLETERGWLVRRIRANGPVLVPFIVKIMDLSDKLGMAMAIRGMGYGDRRTFYRDIRMRGVDYLTVVLSLLIMAGAVILRANGLGVIA